MSEVIDKVREKYPDAYKDVPDDELALRIGTKYPQYLDQDAKFKTEFQSVVADRATKAVQSGVTSLIDVLSNPAAGEAAQMGREQDEIIAGEPSPFKKNVGILPSGEMSTTYGGPPKALASIPETMAALGGIRKPWEEPATPRIEIPRIPITDKMHPLEAIGAEAVNLAIGVPEFFTSPIGTAAPLAAAVAPVWTAGAFTADMLHSLGKQIKATYENWDKMTPNQQKVAITDAVGTGLFATLLSHSVYRGVKPKVEVTSGAEPGKIPNLASPGRTEVVRESMWEWLSPEQKAEWSALPETVQRRAAAFNPTSRTFRQYVDKAKADIEATQPKAGAPETPPIAPTPQQQAEKQLETAAAAAEPVAPVTAAALKTQSAVLEAPKTAETPKAAERPKAVEKETEPEEDLRAQMAEDAAEQGMEVSGEPENFYEQITAASYTHPETGETTTGKNHREAAAQQGVEAPIKPEERHGPEYGFEVLDTATGEKRYVTRGEAELIARANGQLLEEPKRGRLHSDEVKFYEPKEQNAIQEQSANAEVLREPRSELGLSQVGARNAEPEKPAGSQEPVAPQEQAAEKTVELPKYPEKLPPAEGELTSEQKRDRYRQHTQRLGEYYKQLMAWEEQQSQNKGIVFKEPDGRFYRAVTKDPQGGWRVTSFTQLFKGDEKYAPWGHERYNTRYEAVRDAARESELADKLPEIMTEDEIKARTSEPKEEAPAPSDVPSPEQSAPTAETEGKVAQPEESAERINDRADLAIAKNKLQNLIDEGKGKTDRALKLRVKIGELEKKLSKPERVGRGISGLSRFNRETDINGPDILSWLQETGGLLSKSAAKAKWGKEKFQENASQWEDAPGKLYRPHHNVIYSPKGEPPNVKAQAAYEAGLISEPHERALWPAIDAASKARAKAFDTLKRQERILAEDTKQHEDWMTATKEGEERISADQLKPGDKMEVDGEQVEVTHVDAEGTVTLKDGRKFGVQKLEDGQSIHVEKFEPAEEGEVEFGPKEEAQKEEPKPSEAYQGPGDINPPKFETGSKVTAGKGATAREGEIAGTGPKRPGEEQTYFVKTNLGEVLYKESDLEPFKQEPKAQVGEEILFVPKDKRNSEVSGQVTEIIHNTEGEVGYHVLSPLPGDPGRVVRIWDRDGTIATSTGRTLQVGVTGSVEAKAEHSAPKPKVEERPLTKAEQDEFQQLSIKARRARDLGEENLTTEETKRYHELTAMAGQFDLLAEDQPSGVRSRIKQLREKADEMDRLRIRTQERAFESRHRREELFKEARTYDAEAKKAREEADRLERTTPEYAAEIERRDAERQRREEQEEAARARGEDEPLFAQAAKPKLIGTKKADTLLNQLAKDQSGRYSPSRTKLYQQLGEEAVPGIRLQDAEEAGRLYELYKKGEATKAEWEKWVSDAKAQGRVTYRGGGDINPPKFATGTKVIAGEGYATREGEIAGTGPKRPGEEQTYFVKTNLGEVLYNENQLKVVAEPAREEMAPGEEPNIPKQDDKSIPPSGKFRIKNAGPQTYTVIERLPASQVEIENGEQPIRVKNERTGEESTVLESQLQQVKERTTEERAASKGMTRRELDDELRRLKLDPESFTTMAEKKKAIKRAKDQGLSGPGTPSVFQGPDPKAQIEQLTESFQNIKGRKLSFKEKIKREFGKPIEIADAFKQAIQQTPGPLQAKVKAVYDTGKSMAVNNDAVTRALAGLKASGDFVVANWKSATMDEMLRAKGELSAEVEKRGWRVRQFADEIRKAIPDVDQRAAIAKWVDAGGDQNELQWGSMQTNPRYRKAYVDAMNIALSDAESAEYLQLKSRKQTGTLDPAEAKRYAELHAKNDLLSAAENIRNFFESRLQEAIDSGVLDHGVQDYIHRIYEKDPKIAQRMAGYVQSGILSKNPALAKKRFFQMDWEAERLGYRPVQDFLPRITEYETSLSRAIAAREFIRKMVGFTDAGGNKVKGMLAPDGRPVIDVAGIGVPVEDQAGVREATLINPSFKPEDTRSPLNNRSDYKERPEYSALRKWKWAANAKERDLTESEIAERDTALAQATDPADIRAINAHYNQLVAGKPIYVQGNVLIHPDYVGRIDALLKPSALRYSENKVVRNVSRVAMGASSVIKQTMLDFSAFHQVQEIVHGLEHRVMPSRIGIPYTKYWMDLPSVRGLHKMTDVIDFNDPNVDGLMRGGVTLGGEYRDMSEGLVGRSLSRVIPGLRTVMSDYHNFLFQDFIPRLKMTMALHALERNKARYATELANGTMHMEDIYHMTASQANAAFGGLNYTMLERSKTAQDLARLIFLAPDFLEARGRFAAQALKEGAGDIRTAEYWKKGGPLRNNEQRTALFLGAITMYTVARVLNQIIDGQPHMEPENAFSVIYKNKAYSLRTVQGDILHALPYTGHPIQFWMSRLNPVYGRTMLELASGRDYFGRKRNAAEQLWDFVSTLMPVSLRSSRERELWESMVNGLGVTARRYNDVDSAFKLAQKWKDKHGVVEKGEFIYDANKDDLRPLKLALSNNDDAKAVGEIKKLVDSGKYTTKPKVPGQRGPASLTDYFKRYAAMRFTGSEDNDKQFIATLSDDQKKTVEAARQHKISMGKLYKSALAKYQEALKPQGPEVLDEFGLPVVPEEAAPDAATP